MGRIVGIDLGTTNSLVAVPKGDGVTVILQASGDRLLPSVVAVDPLQGLIVGKKAKDGARHRPESTIFSVKRHMGTERKFILGEQELAPQDISALILKELRRAAESHLLAPVDRAVISVPAYFNDPQRRATREAGEMAGLKVEALVSEPTAAALAFGLENLETDDFVLVYDLGGGTFDVTVLEMFEGVFNVRASSGDTRLGGDDIDARIIEWVLRQADGRFKREDLTPEAFAIIRQNAERAKIELSVKNRIGFRLKDLELVSGKTVDLEADLDRGTVEELTQDLLERTGACVAKALLEAKVPREKVGEVVLVGGPTKMPVVKRYLSELFGKAPRDSVDPMEAVAVGAAIRARLLESTGKADEIVLTDVSPFTLGVAVLREMRGEMRPGVFEPLIMRNSSLPATRTKVFHTVRQGQDSVVVEVYQGDDPLVENNIFLDRYYVSGIPSKSTKPEPIEIGFRYDTDGILHVNATVLANGKSAGIRIDPGKMKAVGQGIVASRAKVDALWRSSEARRTLEKVIARVEKSLPSLGTKRKRAEDRLEEARKALEGETAPDELERLADELTPFAGTEGAP